MRRAVALASWLADSGPRLLTGREVLRKPDVPAAAAVIGVKAPRTLRSAADVPDLHRAWLLADGRWVGGGVPAASAVPVVTFGGRWFWCIWWGAVTVGDPEGSVQQCHLPQQVVAGPAEHEPLQEFDLADFAFDSAG